MSLRDSIKDAKEKEEKKQQAHNPKVIVDEDGQVDEEKTQRSMRDSVRAAKARSAGGKVKTEHFKWVKMWINYLVSMTMKDRGKIPDNIGDRILISNNVYITKLYMTTIVQICELGQYTPITMIGVLNGKLREKGNQAILDFTCKNQKYVFDPKKSGLKSRIDFWNRTMDDPSVPRHIRESSTRCKYTVDVAQSGVQLKRSRMFLQIRGKNLQTLNQAEKIVYETLAQMGCTYYPAHSNIQSALEYISIMGNRGTDLKSIQSIMTSNVVLSQLVPNCGSLNDTKGLYVGQNIENGSPYYIDFDAITVARNMYVVAPSGVGKTVLAVNMAQSAYENGSACVFIDIKGNEYTNFINATNGYTVSLRAMSTEFINSWVMHKEDTDMEHAESYFKSRVQFSKQQMIILSGIRNREELLDLEELLDEFHESLYISCGAISTNINSWRMTESLNPYVVFDKFESFLTPQKRMQYNIPKSVIGTIKMYMSVTGSKSYIFKQEFEYSKILASETLSFDFGILSNATISDIDEDLFRLKFLYMQKLNEEFTTRKYAEGKRTFKVLEESQVVSPEIMKMYVQEYTLRRSQKQDTVLLGNSVQALMNNVSAQPIIENTRGLFIGDLTYDSRQEVIKQFGLEHLSDLIKLPGSSAKYKNSFVFVNNMQKKELYPIIQVQIERDENDKPVSYKVNTPVKEKSSMAGA